MRSLIMYYCEIVTQPGDRTDRHAMSDQHGRDPKLSRGEIESDPVRIAVIGYQRNFEIALLEHFRIARMESDEFDHPKNLEKVVASMQPTRDPENPFGIAAFEKRKQGGRIRQRTKLELVPIQIGR